MPLSLTRLWREPLLHFLLIGAALFLYFDRVGDQTGEAPPQRIHISSGQITQLAANFERSRMRQPTPAELDAMVENRVREEVFYREAMAMGLDQDDPMVRRRMRMKLEFMLEELSGQDAGDEALATFLAQNADRFKDEAQLSLHQVYLNPTQHPDLEADARQLLARLADGDDPEALGDRTLAPRGYPLTRQSVIARDFGDPFAGALVSLPVGTWSGPLHSPFGAHLIRIDERIDSRLPELAEIREQVLREYLLEKREQQKKLVYDRLREGYEISVEPVTAEAPVKPSGAVAGETR